MENQPQPLDPILASQNTLAILKTAKVEVSQIKIVGQCVAFLEAIISNQFTVIDTPPPVDLLEGDKGKWQKSKQDK